jgi:hypothetical protein
MTPVQGEVIDSQHPRNRALRQRDAHQDPHRGVPSDRDPESWQQPGRRPASQLAHDPTDLLTESDGASLVSLDQAWYLFSEGLPYAFGDRATHPTYPQPHQNPASIERHIGGDSLVEGVNPARRSATSRTRHHTASG